MNTVSEPMVGQSVAASIAAASAKIAPTWPLDQFIAVNPYWGWRASSAPDTAAMLALLAGTALTMPRTWFRDEWLAGRLRTEHLDAVAIELDEPDLADAARDVLNDAAHEAPTPSRLPLLTDLYDQGPGPRPGQTWTDLVIHQISQHCAAHFDDWQGSWHPRKDADLFAGWRNQLTASHGVAWRHGAKWARATIAKLPDEPTEAIANMLDDLQMPERGREPYLTALLLSVNGWAAWCAYGRWQAQLVGADDDEIVALLAIRLAWEWLLHHDLDERAGSIEVADWANSWTDTPAQAATIADEQRVDWLLQTAVERTYQDSIVGALGDAQPSSAEAPHVQAVFCIDVRSEVFRRALETGNTNIETRGFAGFFGLPIAYTPVGSALTRPQLPGLLAPAMQISETTDRTGTTPHDVRARRSSVLENRQRWSRFRGAPSSVFSFVETLGLGYGPKLVKESLPHRHQPTKWEHEGLRSAWIDGLRPRLDIVDEDPATAAAVGERILKAMGMTRSFAPLVLLCGHGSQTVNNPHAAGLDCGACGGQSGEVNARALADLLNSSDVRAHLRSAGIDIPPSTWFIAALHNTTTDQVQLFDIDLAPDAKQQDLEELENALRAAGHRARSERAPSLSLGHLCDRADDLERAVAERANDWSQVRPEWGLAGNAAFIVAPRSRTRHLDLDGRCFLHDYNWRDDTDLSVLSLIMTAPMVVTNWINLQYHASTVDNRRYGSGNKVLHNVVGGRVGVFEGNGGDLRIGLSMQSLHDGSTLRHRPLRLSVFIEAPRECIDAVFREQLVVQHLVANSWLHLLRIEPSTGIVERWTSTGWTADKGEG